MILPEFVVIVFLILETETTLFADRSLLIWAISFQRSLWRFLQQLEYFRWPSSLSRLRRNAFSLLISFCTTTILFCRSASRDKVKDKWLKVIAFCDFNMLTSYCSDRSTDTPWPSFLSELEGPLVSTAAILLSQLNEETNKI